MTTAGNPAPDPPALNRMVRTAGGRIDPTSGTAEAAARRGEAGGDRVAAQKSAEPPHAATCGVPQFVSETPPTPALGAGGVKTAGVWKGLAWAGRRGTAWWLVFGVWEDFLLSARQEDGARASAGSS